MDVVIDLARHAQSCGADYIVVHAPILHFFKAQDETLLRYYETIASKVDIGIALWSHPDSGYLMSPATVQPAGRYRNRGGDQIFGPAPDVCRTDPAGGRPDHRVHRLGRGMAGQYPGTGLAAVSVFLAALSDPDRRGQTDARLYRRGLCRAMRTRRAPSATVWTRCAMRCKSTRPAEKPHAHQKYWQALLGQTGGRVRPPCLELTEAEKAQTRACL